MTDPKHVLIVGDLHGNTGWAKLVAHRAEWLLPDEPKRIILQLGDFGIWGGLSGARFLETLSKALSESNSDLWFVHGNHEDFPRLYELAARGTDRGPGFEIAPRIVWLPTGATWAWHDIDWMVAGGAVSVDRSQRREGFDWWPDEELTENDVDDLIRIGKTDVLLAHDCPASVPLSLPRPPSFWDVADLARAHAHRERLQRLVDGVKPEWVFHGHYHLTHRTTQPMAHGDVHVAGLDMDDTRGNYIVWDAEEMVEVAQ